MKAVDLFSGCGGLSLGLQKAGIDIVAAYENWDAAINIYKQNFRHEVKSLDLNDVKAAVDDIGRYKPDMIVGGPPCQDFSSAGTRNDKGSRSILTLCYAEIVASVKPKWFIMENVARLQKVKMFSDVKQILSNAGYGLTDIVLDASHCNVPQSRKRLFLIGKLGEKDDFLKEFLVKRLSKESMTLREYFGNKLNTEYYYRHARSYARRGIFSVDEPSPTIRGVNRPIPPEYKSHAGDATTDLSKVRPLTTEERAIIQTFPKNFKWGGLPKSVLEQIIGNAVPVNLAKHVGTAIVDHEADILKMKKKTKV